MNLVAKSLFALGSTLCVFGSCHAAARRARAHNNPAEYLQLLRDRAGLPRMIRDEEHRSNIPIPNAVVADTILRNGPAERFLGELQNNLRDLEEFGTGHDYHNFANTNNALLPAMRSPSILSSTTSANIRIADNIHLPRRDGRNIINPRNFQTIHQTITGYPATPQREQSVAASLAEIPRLFQRDASLTAWYSIAGSSDPGSWITWFFRDTNSGYHQHLRYQSLESLYRLLIIRWDANSLVSVADARASLVERLYAEHAASLANFTEIAVRTYLESWGNPDTTMPQLPDVLDEIIAHPPDQATDIRTLIRTVHTTIVGSFNAENREIILNILEEHSDQGVLADMVLASVVNSRDGDQWINWLLGNSQPDDESYADQTQRLNTLANAEEGEFNSILGDAEVSYRMLRYLRIHGSGNNQSQNILIDALESWLLPLDQDLMVRYLFEFPNDDLEDSEEEQDGDENLEDSEEEQDGDENLEDSEEEQDQGVCDQDEDNQMPDNAYLPDSPSLSVDLSDDDANGRSYHQFWGYSG